ncbi:MAG: ABC transporter ATP-binding protein [Actinomycetota bacterium]
MIPPFLRTPSPVDEGVKRADPAMRRRVFTLFLPYRRLAVLTISAIAAAAGLGVIPPLLARRIVDEAIPQQDVGLLVWLVVGMVVLPLAGALLGVAQTYMSTVIGQRVMHDLRNAMYRALRRQGMRFFTDTRAGELVSRVTADVSGVETVVTTTLAGIVSSVLVVLTTLIAMTVISPLLTIISIGVLPLFIWPTRRVGMLRRELARRRQERLAKLSSLVEETLGVSGAMLVKMFGRDAYEEYRFNNETKDLMRIAIRESVLGRWFFLTIQTFWLAAPAIVWLIGGRRAIAGAFSIGSIVAFTALQSRLFIPVTQLLSVTVDVNASFALFERIFEYTDLMPDIVERESPILLEQAKGRLTFDRVSFGYRQDIPVLKDVSFELPPGKMVALVGPSGAGKTTIGHLVVRLYDVWEGAVMIDGVDVRDCSLESVARTVGVVAQDTFLFHTTIREHLLYARPEASDGQIAEAAKAAQIHSLISELPDGYDTVVGERGHRLSGGETQRIAIARALLKDPAVLLLDEATSALDTRSERLIQRALEELMKGRTALVIAHRLSTVLAADQILVLDRGRIAERGTHHELLKRQGLYSRLYSEQFASEPKIADVIA